MKIKVIMSDKAMSRETMDAREKMLKVALSSECRGFRGLYQKRSGRAGL